MKYSFIRPQFSLDSPGNVGEVISLAMDMSKKSPDTFLKSYWFCAFSLVDCPSIEGFESIGLTKNFQLPGSEISFNLSDSKANFNVSVFDTAPPGWNIVLWHWGPSFIDWYRDVSTQIAIAPDE